MFDVAVFGSCMIDFISYVKRNPEFGETIHSENFKIGFGGKGSNQAIASARLGCKTAMIGKIGSDEYGKNYKRYFEEEGINTDFLETAGEYSGIALIVVNSVDGNNQIVINSNANKNLTAKDCERAKSILDQSKILICQLETPIEGTLEAMRNFKGFSILNAAPAMSNLPEDAFKLPNIFCVNELEAQEFTNIKLNEVSDAKRIIQSLINDKGCKIVIITLGKHGAAFNDESGQIYHVPVQEDVKVIDSTGAGDAFIGALAYFFAKFPEASLLQKMSASVSIATHSVQSMGTQSSYVNFPKIDPTAKGFKFNLL